VQEAFDDMNKKENEHKWWPWDQCKTEAQDLLDRAEELKKEADQSKKDSDGAEDSGDSSDKK
jgi:hypothetical protein